MIYQPIAWETLDDPLDILFIEIPGRKMMTRDELFARGRFAKFKCEKCLKPMSRGSARYGTMVLCRRCNKTHTFDKCGLVVTWEEARIIREMVENVRSERG